MKSPVGGIAALLVLFVVVIIGYSSVFTVAQTEHGEAFASVVQRGQVAGVQFHPEKSGDVGLQVLRNFVQGAG